MYLLILFLHLQRYVLPWHLHPTMYLLIPSKTAILIIIVQRFTSHYVSINSNPITELNIYVYNLHPTMYLLILMLHMKHSVILQNLHPTMYLLILIAAIILLMALLHLHPTMYLLIL